MHEYANAFQISLPETTDNKLIAPTPFARNHIKTHYTYGKWCWISSNYSVNGIIETSVLFNELRFKYNFFILMIVKVAELEASQGEVS